MKTLLKTVLVTAGLALAVQASAQVTFYEHEDFEGRSFTSVTPINNFLRIGFNDRASSVVVLREPWEVCDDVRFGGRCVTLRPGTYSSLADIGLNDRVSSARAMNRYPPVAPISYRRSNNERLYQANVVSVRAVLGAPEQRCWVEREQVTQERSNANVPGAIVGALIGGILGHQVGGGSGKNLATAGGVVAGAALGSNVGRDGSGQQVVTQDVQRCANTPSNARPEYWDVIYSFRGMEHHLQMRSPPGSTITVNRRGEPRE